jgi:mono/diheme cytochrome c family protein
MRSSRGPRVSRGWRCGSALAALCLLALPTQAQTAPPLEAPDEATLLGSPLSQAGEGRRLFLKLNCYSCHGMGATGGMGPNIVHRSLAEVRSAVLGGRAGGMPSFAGHVDDKDIRRIAAYLKVIGTDREPVFNDWWIKVPPK